MKVLLVDNNILPKSWGSADLRGMIRYAPNATVYVRRAPPMDLPDSPKGFDRVILSGSKTSASEDGPWIERLHRFVSQVIDLEIPFLGVCYGHQTLARVVAGSQVCARAKRPEIGWTEIQISEESVLMEGLPKRFWTFSTHYDEVGTLPRGMKRLASSKDCALQAIQFENRPVFGIQFHPEKGIKEAEECFREKRADPKTTNDPLLHPKESAKLFDESVGRAIFTNFFSL